jgi:cytochrome c-type biogenesis protein CcmH/NrfG
MWVNLVRLACCSILLTAGSASGSEEQRVELVVKIVSSRPELAHKTWRLELLRSTGEPLTGRTVLEGQSTRFKRLEPGYYMVCVYNRWGRRSCSSMDLTPKGQGSAEFTKEIRAPDSLPGSGDLHRVHLWRLAIPEDAHREWLRSLEAQRAGDRPLAVEHLRRAVEIYPKYVDAWSNLGALLQLDGEREEAVRCLTRAAEIDPGNYSSWLNLAVSRLSQQQFEKALSAATKAYKLRPGEALANFYLGLCHYYLRDLKAAKSLFSRAAALDPASINSPQRYLAHIALAWNRVAEALDYYRAYLRWHPNASDAADVRRSIRNLSAHLEPRARVQQPER